MFTFLENSIPLFIYYIIEEEEEEKLSEINDLACEHGLDILSIIASYLSIMLRNIIKSVVPVRRGYARYARENGALPVGPKSLVLSTIVFSSFSRNILSYKTHLVGGPLGRRAATEKSTTCRCFRYPVRGGTRISRAGRTIPAPHRPLG